MPKNNPSTPAQREKFLTWFGKKSKGQTLRFVYTIQIMDLSTFAYIIGPLELLIGIPLLIKPDTAAKWVLDFVKNHTLMRVLGAVLTVIGVLVLADDYSIGSDAAGLLRLVAWIVLIKGVFLAWYPEKAGELSERHLSVPAMRFVAGFIAVIIGVLFMVAGKTLA